MSNSQHGLGSSSYFRLLLGYISLLTSNRAEQIRKLYQSVVVIFYKSSFLSEVVLRILLYMQGFLQQIVSVMGHQATHCLFILNSFLYTSNRDSKDELS